MAAGKSPDIGSEEPAPRNSSTVARINITIFHAIFKI
jgi:hypothetical protein